MFALPSAKRIRRNDLDSPASSPRSSPDLEITELLRSRAIDKFAFTAPFELADEQNNDVVVTDDEEETELVLFAAPSASAPQTHKIRLQSPDAGNVEPGLLVKKPQSYYFVENLSSKQEAQFQAAAIDSEVILSLSKNPWPGSSLPWKVRTISPTGIRKPVLVGHPKTLVSVEEKVHKRKRKGKKSRIALRKKMRKIEEEKEQEERSEKEKGDAESEKRTRKNREKKAKKRMRDKAKKMAEGAEGADRQPVDEEADKTE